MSGECNICGHMGCVEANHVKEVAMETMQEITCACGCGRKRMVRTADIKRGWGKYYSKRCKAKAQERRTGQYRSYLHREHKLVDYRDIENDFHPHDSYSLGQE
jgi:hypothetical protein